MKNPDKACTVFVMSSNYPRFSGDICGWFIHEISRRIAQKGYRVITLSPHTQNSVFLETMDAVKVYRFVYFFPALFEKLAYGSGILYNIRKSPIAFLNIFPFFLSEFFWAIKIIRQNQVKIVHTHWLLPQGLIGAIIHRIIGTPHVATIHGSDVNLIKNFKLLKILCRFIVGNSDMITVNSSYMKQQLLSIAPDSAEKIQIIPMGVDPEKYHDVGNPDLNRKFESNRVILSVGRLIDWKGTIYLIDAMPLVLQRYPNALLLIIGSGPEMEHLVQRVHQLTLEENVTFLGVVSNEDLQAYYHAADVFVLPSINKSGKTEGLGVVLLEAMASGCPVIGSNVGGIPDIIRDEENGFLVPEQDPSVLAERIVRIFSDANLREKFRKNGHSRIEESYTWDTIAERFSEVYLKAIRNPIQPGDLP